MAIFIFQVIICDVIAIYRIPLIDRRSASRKKQAAQNKTKKDEKRNRSEIDAGNEKLMIRLKNRMMSIEYRISVIHTQRTSK